MAVSQNVKDALERVALSGGTVGAAVGTFDTEIRINDGSNMFAEGDKFTIPTGADLDACRFIRMFQGNRAPGIVVDVNGTSKELYLSSFVKSVVTYNDDSTRAKDATGKDLPAIIATGTAVDLWKKSIKAEDGLQSIAGRTLEIKEIKQVQTMRQNNGGTRRLGNQWVYTIDLV